MDNSEYKRVDYRRVWQEIYKRKKIYIITIPIVFVLSCLYITCIPRTYSSSTEVALETESKGGTAGGLGALAASFGINTEALETSDAITPLLYPDLLNDNGFISGLFNIKVCTLDGKIKTDYYTYIEKYQQYPWWTKFGDRIKRTFHKEEKKDTKNTTKNPYHLTKKDDGILNAIRKGITLKIDKKTGAINISTTAQDPLICKTIADSVREHLQQFITRYRTNKAREDVQYFRKLTEDAKRAYEKQRKLYGSYSDANMDVMLESFISKRNDLENEMQLRYNNYTTYQNQLQTAIAKVQEKTPAFTIIKGAEVPLKPIAPKRMIFVLVMTILGFVATSVYVLRDIIIPKSKQ